MRQLELRCSAGRNVKYYDYFEKLFVFLINIYVPYNQRILLPKGIKTFMCIYRLV